MLSGTPQPHRPGSCRAPDPWDTRRGNRACRRGRCRRCSHRERCTRTHPARSSSSRSWHPSMQSATPSPSWSKSAKPQPHMAGRVFSGSSGQQSLRRRSGSHVHAVADRLIDGGVHDGAAGTGRAAGFGRHAAHAGRRAARAGRAPATGRLPARARILSGPLLALKGPTSIAAIPIAASIPVEAAKDAYQPKIQCHGSLLQVSREVLRKAVRIH